MSKKKKIVLVLAVLLVVIGAGVGFYFYNKKKQSEQAPEGAASTPGTLPNTPLSAEETIKALYREILGREADQGGQDYWTTYLKSSTYEDVRARFFSSPEYLAKTKVA